MSRFALTLELANELAKAPLAHVTRQYPYKLDHIMMGPEDVLAPIELHPIFHGSLDWHSCVHGWWTMLTLRRLYPELPVGDEIDALADTMLTPAKVAGELAYLTRPASGGFERPYGWAWLLMLVAELSRHRTPRAMAWHDALAPLGAAFADRFKAFLPKSPYPVRAGIHNNTAFALRLTLEYANTCADAELAAMCRAKAEQWYGRDRASPDLEPSQDDFLSSTLIEIEFMRHALAPPAFQAWLARYLPETTALDALLAPPQVTDRTDGKMAHLDGLCLSRAWCWRGLASVLETSDSRHGVALRAAEAHLAAALPHLNDDYMGQHWLASFALLALADR